MLAEGTELTGESGKSYLVVSPLGQANVWTAVEVGNLSNIVVIKQPGADDTGYGWPNFQNEMVMHELLKDCSGIRKQVDRIAPTTTGEPPMLVLEIFQTTLWGARTKRPLSGVELKSVMKDALIGLNDVHARGQVYADLKMPNIMVDGFNPDSPSGDSNLTAKLGDLGIVMEPANGKVQPVSYRAPEVYFRGVITSKADIWSWALIYCHLLEAQNRFSKTGLYDDLDTGSGTMPEREEAVKYAMSNDYEMQTDAYFQSLPLPPNDAHKNRGDQWQELRRRGLNDGEVDFLRWVMRADPRKRPSAKDILRTGWLDKTDEEVAAGFEVPTDSHGRASMEFDPRRSSPEEGLHDRHTSVNATVTKPAPNLPQSTAVSASQSEPYQSPINRPSYNARSSSTAVDKALEEVYATRKTYKRNLSHQTTDPAGKKQYTTTATPVGGDNNSTAENVVQYVNPDSVNSSATIGNPLLQPVNTTSQGRPGFSTKNTGTMLSYY